MEDDEAKLSCSLWGDVTTTIELAFSEHWTHEAQIAGKKSGNDEEYDEDLKPHYSESSRKSFC